jgi:phosphoserine phosphatase RsbX
MISNVCASGGPQLAERGAPPWLEWAVAARPLPGEEVSGDAALVELDDGGAVVAAVDGLGHGAPAAAAASRAVAALRGRCRDDVDALVGRCHEALRGTRGAALGVAKIAGDELTWAGVGNVEAWLFGRGRPAALLLRPGVVGEALPPAQPVREQLRRGDVVVLVSDGVGSGFVDAFEAIGSPQRIADAILDGYARESDDAVVVVARYLGGAAA